MVVFIIHRTRGCAQGPGMRDVPGSVHAHWRCMMMDETCARAEHGSILHGAVHTSCHTLIDHTYGPAPCCPCPCEPPRPTHVLCKLLQVPHGAIHVLGVVGHMAQRHSASVVGTGVVAVAAGMEGRNTPGMMGVTVSGRPYKHIHCNPESKLGQKQHNCQCEVTSTRQLLPRCPNPTHRPHPT